MKKKFFAFVLAFAMLLSSLVSINDVSFAEDNAFEIYEDGELKLSSSDVDEISTFHYNGTNAYTIKVLKDLVVPAESGSLKTITLKGNVTVEGNGHTISGANGGAPGDRLIKIMPGSNVIINNVVLNGDKKYAGILAKAMDESEQMKLSINSSTIEACYAYAERHEGSGGGLNLNNTDFTINNSIIKNCAGNAGGAISCASGHDINIKGSILESTLDGNSSDEGGAINNSILALEIINSKIINNSAYVGAAISNNAADIKIINSTISYNKAESDEDHCRGGAISLEICEDKDVRIEGGEISYNHSNNIGGAINAELFELRTHQPLNYIKIDRNVVFKGNTAGDGYFNPPEDFYQNNNFTNRGSSLTGKLIRQLNNGKWTHVDSLVNNYDIAFINNFSTVAYDPNGGYGDLFVETEETTLGFDVEPIQVRIKSLKETKISNSRRFLGWNTEADGSGRKYLPGQTIDVKGNLTLFAQWEKPSVTLILDENYRGGRVTEKELLVGDLIEPHLYKPKRRGFTFKGWSYNKKHLDKVHYDDRIYEDTTVYAIWDEVEEEPEEIKGKTHKAYIFGYPDGTVRPNGEITRAEAAAMLARLLEIESIGSAEAPSFPDTPSAWYNKAINAVVQRDIMKGYPDGTFRPNDAITRAEFTQMISTIDNKPYGTAPFADVVGHWAERPIGSEYQAGRILGYPDGTFRPDAHITRCEAAVILNKIFERNFDNMSLIKCKNPQMIKYFIDLEASFWGYNDMVEATNDHEYIRRTQNRVEENWLLIK